MTRRAVITGIGLATPLGIGTDATWDRLVDGDGAIAPIAGYDATTLRTQVGAEIANLGNREAREYVDRRQLRTMTRYDMLASVAGFIAMKDAGLEGPQEDPEGRFGLFTASGKEVSEPDHFKDVSINCRDEAGVAQITKFGELAAQEVAPLFYIEGLQAGSLFFLSETFMLRGANTFFAGGAEAGLNAVGRAFRSVRRGESDAVLAGSGDAPVCWWNMGKIDSVGLTTRAGAVRPYDVARDGTAMGEGGAFVLVESLDAAQARGAKVYAEITGFGSGSDVAHYITPDAEGGPLAGAIGRALRDAGSAAENVDYVVSDGSGTRQGDASEAAALRAAFGTNGSGPAVSANKAALGHMGAASGAGNAAVAALAIDRGAMPPNVNLEHLDPACSGVDWVTGSARSAPVREAVAVARGLEGQNVALVLRAP